MVRATSAFVLVKDIVLKMPNPIDHDDLLRIVVWTQTELTMFLFMNRSASCQTTGQPRCEAEPDLSWDCHVDPYAPLTLVAALQEIEVLRNVLREQWDHLQELGQAIEQAGSAFRQSNKGHPADSSGPCEDLPRQD